MYICKLLYFVVKTGPEDEDDVRLQKMDSQSQSLDGTGILYGRRRVLETERRKVVLVFGIHRTKTGRGRIYEDETGQHITNSDVPMHGPERKSLPKNRMAM